jgi:tetratricopeptide (TPR) repeat protein
LLDAEGEEIDRFVGFEGEEEKDEYIQKIKDFAAGKNTLPVLLSDLENDASDVETNYKLAEKYNDRYEVEKAQSYFDKVLKLDPEDKKGHKVEATSQIALFQARSLKAFIASNPDDEYLLSSYRTLASYYGRKKENENIIATYEEALQKMPENAKLMYYYASAVFDYQIESHYEKGLELNDKAKALDSDLEEDAFYNLIQYYQNIDDKEKIITAYKEAVQKSPDDMELKLRFAISINNLRIESHYDLGIALTNELLEDDPKIGVRWYLLGLLHHKSGNLEKAIEAVKKAVDGNLEKAIEAVKKAVELSPGAKSYKDRLEKFEKEAKQ